MKKIKGSELLKNPNSGGSSACKHSAPLVSLFTILLLALYGCASHKLERPASDTATPSCAGSVDLLARLAKKFEPADNERLLSEALGGPKQGKLCQGKVYKSKSSGIMIFRAWNSTNPNSKLGKWWAFHKPAGKVSAYRSDYEICYQWSPLDKLVRCRLKPGIEVVVGTGQSADCSEYLSYPISDKQQIYIDDASMSVTDCVVFDGVFEWR